MQTLLEDDAMERYLVVFGARPSAVKLAPVVHALDARGASAAVCLTGQHGREMLDLDTLGLYPAYQREQAGGDVVSRLANMARFVGDVLRERPGFAGVIVVGDTISGMAGALAGAYADVPVAHVEAGLRTGAREPWPEEMTRRAIDTMAHWHFAPTPIARRNLRSEGLPVERLHIVGNTVVDSLKNMGVKRFTPDRPTVLVTIHRRENWSHIRRIAETVRKLAELHIGVRFAWPVHP
ncbi:MAG: UDP-N-acetylglucosamine 2-epimerase, partial [Planctomycetota bacterium]|nr:UDP-N-acetylglucosamine 2-epimerase [Planctomycetota bacterium]